MDEPGFIVYRCHHHDGESIAFELTDDALLITLARAWEGGVEQDLTRIQVLRHPGPSEHSVESFLDVLIEKLIELRGFLPPGVADSVG